MPANLTQQYHRAEQAFRAAQSPDEELLCLQRMLRELPKHKGTDKLQADLKSKIAKLKKEQLQWKSSKRNATHCIPRQGAGRVVLLGGPNAGKSSLLKALTRAQPEIAAYPFTTREPAPGMMPHEDVLIQLIDTPPITPDMLDTGTQSLIRGADMILLIADMGSDDGIDRLQDVLNRLSETKTRLARHSHLSDEDVGLSFTATLLLLNKMDAVDANARGELFSESFSESCELDFDVLPVSAQTGLGFESLRKAVFRSLDIVRVYTKAPNRREADLEKPFTLKRGGTLLEVAELVHKDLAASFRFARVWAHNASDSAVMKGDYIVRDRDIVEIHG